MKTRRHHWWLVNIGSGNGLVPFSNKPLLEPGLTQIYVAIDVVIVFSYFLAKIQHGKGQFLTKACSLISTAGLVSKFYCIKWANIYSENPHNLKPNLFTYENNWIGLIDWWLPQVSHNYQFHIYSLMYCPWALSQLQSCCPIRYTSHAINSLTPGRYGCHFKWVNQFSHSFQWLIS